MKKFDLWMEGYRATCEGSDATYIGTYYADTFEEACKMYAKFKGITLGTHGGMLADWGRRIFDNEDDARKSYG